MPTIALAHTSNTLAMNFLCGTRTFWLFGLPKVTECGQGDFISPRKGEFGPRVVVFCLLSFTAPKGKPELRPLFRSALSALRERPELASLRLHRILVLRRVPGQ
jgi:hypothetical protein